MRPLYPFGGRRFIYAGPAPRLFLPCGLSSSGRGPSRHPLLCRASGIATVLSLRRLAARPGRHAKPSFHISVYVMPQAVQSQGNMPVPVKDRKHEAAELRQPPRVCPGSCPSPACGRAGFIFCSLRRASRSRAPLSCRLSPGTSCPRRCRAWGTCLSP